MVIFFHKIKKIGENNISSNNFNLNDFISNLNYQKIFKEEKIKKSK